MTPDYELKKQAFEKCMQAGVVTVFLVPSAPGVRIPRYLTDEKSVILNFNAPKGAKDLVVNQWGVAETLSFCGSREQVRIPWSAIFVIAEEATRAARFVATEVDTGVEERVEAVEAEVPVEQPEQKQVNPNPRRGGHLRLLN